MMRMFVVLALVLSVVGAARAEDPAASMPLRMGCVAYAKAATADAYKLVRDYLASELKRDISLTVYPSYHEVVHDIVNDKLDLAILSPLVYLNAIEARPMHTLAYAVSRGSGCFSYHAQILVKKDSPVQSLADLAGKKMAFVDIISASGFVLPKDALTKAGVTGGKNVVASFHKNHVDTLRALLEGKADAAATYDQIFSDSKPMAAEKDKLRVVWTSEFVIPADAVVADDHMPAAERQQIRAALLSYFSAQQRKTCAENGMYEGFVPGDPTLYNDLKRLIQKTSRN